MASSESKHFFADGEDGELTDDTLREIAEAVERDESGTHVTNIKRLKDVKLVYRLLEHITSGEHLQILYELNKPYTSMAYVSVVGDALKFEKPELFAVCSSIASNIEIYARTDGKTQVNFTFNGFTNKIN